MTYIYVSEEDREKADVRFWKWVTKAEDGCWIWTGSRKTGRGGGYGQFYVGYKDGKTIMARAHRWAYEQLVGPIPEGATLDHLCRNRACVNPGHLEPVTNRENVLRGEGCTARNARKTHCERGHEYTPENTYITARGHRRCRECKREWQRQSRQKKRSA